MNPASKGWPGLLPALVLAVAMSPVLAVAAAPPPPAKPVFDPRTVRGEIAGAPTQVLVIGTMHL